MVKVLIVNLSFTRKVQRDMGCPHTVKADYYWPPQDLLVYGAILKGWNSAGLELQYLDCIMEKLCQDDAVKKIISHQPEHIFTIVSSVTLKEDLETIEKVKKELPGVKVWASGDVMFFGTKKYPGIDFHIHDMTNKKRILELIGSGAKEGEIERDNSPEFSIGVCTHEFALKYQYLMPHSLYVPTTVVLTNYGCPFKCKFCNSNKLNFKKRNLDEVIEELKYVQKIGIRDIFFKDFTFGVPNAKEICERMISENIRINWSCETRVDVVNEELLRIMKAAGCYLIFYGVESGNDETLKKVMKGFNTARVKEMIKKTKEIGIETLTSFILGLPDDDIDKTIKFMFEIDPDYLSINLLVPRVGSTIRDEMNADESSNTDCRYSTPELVKRRNETEKKFYLKPTKLVRYLILAAKSPLRLKIFANNAIGLIGKWNEKNEDSAAEAEGME